MKTTVRKVMIATTIVLSMTVDFTPAAAQPEAGSTVVRWVRPNRAYAENRYEDGDEVNDYTWWFWYDEVQDRAHHLCITLDWDYNKKKSPPFWHDFDADQANPVVDTQYPVTHPFTDVQHVGMEGYEDDAGDRCDYNTKDDGDDGPCIGYDQFVYGDYPPGMMNTRSMRCNDWGLEFEFRYDVPVPGLPQELYPVTTNPNNICTTTSIPLTVQNYINPKFANDGRFRFEIEWQYGPTTNGPWNTFYRSTPYFDFSTTYPRAEANFDYNIFKNIDANTDFYYRVITHMTMQITNANDWAGRVFSSPPSAPNVMHISPIPPAVTITANEPSCPNDGHSSGKISLNVTGKGNYIWSMRTGTVTGPCDPLASNSNCGAHSGQLLSNTLDINDIAPGSYTLLVTNYPASTRGVCTTWTPVTINALPTLQTQPPDITQVSCPGGTDGAIQVKYAGGVAPWTYSLTKTGYKVDSDDGSFTALTTGTYTSAVTDGCQQVASAPVTVPEPLRITAATTPSNPTCTAPFNGAVKVDITQGEGTYTFNITHNGETVDHLDAAAINTWTVQHLTDGDFTLEIRDAQRPQCDVTTLPLVTLALPKDIKLLPDDISQKNLTCFEQNDGNIQLSNVDLGGTFKYTLAGETTGLQRALTTTALFDNLPADSYHLVALRNVDGCTDAVEITTPVVVTQPDKIVITLNKADVKCFNDDNGTVTPVVAGSTQTDEYLWETLLDGDWATYHAGRTALDHLAPGSYRLQITNASNCHGESDPIDVIQPDALIIAGLDLQDMPCYGGNGEIKATVQGGVIPYTYHYHTANGTTDFTSTTARLPQGNYAFSVSDKNGCVTTSDRQLTITEPPQILAFTYTVSDFNGYNISCAGARNGVVEFAAVGGNGTGYTGYQYALNDRPFQDEPRFDGMGPGPHTLFVRDSRGCAVSKYVTFVEPASQLVTSLLSRGNVKCQNDLTGKLSIVASGGVVPYTFILNDTVTQTNGTFTGLGAAEYTIQIVDKNGCSTQYLDKINTQYPPMAITLHATDVTCYAGTNGSILADVTGGEGALRQQWTRGLDPVSNPNQLSVGSYILTVTDAAGCVLKAGATLLEPEQIQTQTTVIPVCVGKTTGEIWLRTTGGTGAYHYSPDGNTFQDSPILKNLAAGTYNVQVKDANNCVRIFATPVTVRNDQPKPDFLVASNENALDTLVVNEISVPKADSVNWSFDPAIDVINPDSWSPQILVHEPGSYTLSMTGYFGGCDYTKTATLTINPFNPEENVKIAAPYETIQTMTATPNPTDGEFTVTIELNAKQDIAISVIDYLGVAHYHETWRKTKTINETVNVKNAQLAPGIYIVRAVTSTDAREVRIMIQP